MIKKKVNILRGAALFALLAAVLLSSCGLQKFEYADGGTAIYDKKTGIKYLPCSFSLSAASLSAEPYAVYGNGYKLYAVTGLDPEKWISEDITEGLPYLFRAESESEPAFEDFDADVIYLTETVSVTVKIGDMTDKDGINGIKNEFLTGEVAPVPSAENTASSYTLNFSDPKFPGMYYKLRLLLDYDGNTYLYDFGTGRCVKTYSFNVTE